MTDLLTVAERTDYRETSRHADVLSFIDALQARRKGFRIESMGKSALGQEMPVLIFGDGSRAKPVILVIANIHAGEVEGKEALLMLARDLPESAFEKLTLLLVPDYNPDGNDRIDVMNRALDLSKLEGQIGPVGGVGTRYTGEGINLNRDYVKLEAPESRHLSKLYGTWRPHLTIDCHTTDGSIHGFALTYDTSHIPTAPCEHVRTRLLPEASRRLESRTHLKTFFYGNFVDEKVLSKGWATYPALPRYGSHYRGLTGRMDILLEAYSYIPFRERVVVTVGILKEILDYAGAHAAEIMKICADEEAARPGTVGISYGPPEPIGECEIFAWDMESQLARRIPGRETRSYRIPHLAKFSAVKSVSRPAAYLIRREMKPVIDKLRQHTIPFAEASRATIEGYAFIVETLAKAPSPDVGSMTRLETVLTVRTERRSIPANAGDFLVSTDHPLGTLATYLLEPESDDGLSRWGFFDDGLKRGAELGVYRVAGL